MTVTLRPVPESLRIPPAPREITRAASVRVVGCDVHNVSRNDRIISRFFDDGMTLGQIAKAMKISRNVVAGVIHRARENDKTLPRADPAKANMGQGCTGKPSRRRSA